MGAEMGQWIEWNCDASLDWHLLRISPTQRHRKMGESDPAMPSILVNQPCTKMTVIPTVLNGVDCQDNEQSILCFLRKGKEAHDTILVACNFTPLPPLGLPYSGSALMVAYWKELLEQ